MLGETNPANSAPGTIRGDLCTDIGRWVSPRRCTQLSLPSAALHDSSRS